jgi:hypothetical protein
VAAGVINDVACQSNEMNKNRSNLVAKSWYDPQIDTVTFESATETKAPPRQSSETESRVLDARKFAPGATAARLSFSPPAGVPFLDAMMMTICQI